MNRAKHVLIAAGVAALAIGGCKKNDSAPAEPSAPGAQAPTEQPPADPPPAAAEAPSGGVATEEVSYKAGDVEMKGFMAYPDDGEKHPGVLVVHEWWGQNDYARSRAKQLADMGYSALALDMFGGGKVAEHPKDAQAFAGEVSSNMEVAKQRFMAAKDVLAASPHTDPDRIAAIGYCFGGGIVLNMARMGVDLDLVASFHGMLGTEQPMKPGAFDGTIFVAHGNADPFVPQKQVTAFKKEMDAAGVDFQFVGYEGAKHAFTNPDATANGEKFDLPLAYDAAADQASWNQLTALLEAAWPDDQAPDDQAEE